MLITVFDDPQGVQSRHVQLGTEMYELLCELVRDGKAMLAVKLIRGPNDDISQEHAELIADSVCNNYSSVRHLGPNCAMYCIKNVCDHAVDFEIMDVPYRAV